jgi:hypothetical protein
VLDSVGLIGIHGDTVPSVRNTFSNLGGDVPLTVEIRRRLV